MNKQWSEYLVAAVSGVRLCCCIFFPCPGEINISWETEQTQKSLICIIHRQVLICLVSMSLEILLFFYTARGNKYNSRISKELCQSQDNFVGCLNRPAIPLWVHTVYGQRKQLPARHLPSRSTVRLQGLQCTRSATTTRHGPWGTPKLSALLMAPCPV